MTESSYLQGKVLKRSLPVLQGSPPADALGPKRLLLPQGELANFYDGQEGIRYIAYIEMREGTVRGNHWHRVKEEQIYVISGELLLVTQDRESEERASVELRKGDLAFISPGIAHALKTVAPGQAVEFSRTKFDATDVQRLKLL
jgi:uncharacterized RmlC-like cupin family protein